MAYFPLKFTLELDPHCEVQEGGKLNPTKGFRHGGIEKGLGLNSIKSAEWSPYD